MSNEDSNKPASEKTADRGSVRKKRRRRTRSAPDSSINQKPFLQPVRQFPPVDLASTDAVDAIHHASLKVLNETGIKVLHDGARVIMKDAGADVDETTQTVRFDEQLIEKHLATVPSQFTLYARNPEHNLQIGGDKLLFGLMASAPNSSCLDHGRRTGNQKDFRDFLRLGQMHNILHFSGGYPAEPTDLSLIHI